MKQVELFTQADYPTYICSKCNEHGELFRFITNDAGAVYWICAKCVANGLNEGRTSYILANGQVIGKDESAERDGSTTTKVPRLICEQCDQMRDRAEYEVVCATCRASSHYTNVTTSDDGIVELDGIEVRW